MKVYQPAVEEACAPVFVGRWLAGAYQKGKIVLLHTRHEAVPQVMGRNGRQRRMDALLTVVTAMFAVLLMMAGMTTPALAAEQHAAVTINAERVAAGEYRLTITNNGSETIVKATGVTTVPQEILADGAAASYAWQVSGLQSGASAVAQQDGKALTIHIKEGSTSGKTKEQITDNTAATVSTDTQRKTTDNKAVKKSAGILGSTGSAVYAIALIAVGLAGVGISCKWENGRLAVRRTIAVLGTVAMIAGCMYAVPQRQASAAQHTATAQGVTSAITVNGKEYQLASDVTITYEQVATLSSTEYAKAMGAGWNLGNSFDGVNTDLSAEDKGEEAWGNPKVTRELIHSVKEKGYTSIRIPMTVYHRSSENKDAKDGEYRYVINADWLQRYKEVVDWAVDEGLYVMINIHHDSWIWLKNWNGDTSAAEYQEFNDYWKQIASYFADEPLSVCFETINEPQFANGDAQAKLNAVSKAAYDIIRATAGNEQRMIVIPTLGTAHDDTAKLQATVDFIHKDLKNDANVIATVHYYSEWVYSANLGRTGFDESIYGDERTPRNVIDSFADRMNQYFTENGIGLVIGEYGLLAYDSSSDGALQAGEELKYYEYMGTMANENGFSYMFWDNGSGIDRTSYQWKKPLAGKMLEASINGRSSYATGLDTLYLEEDPTGDVKLPLTLNGNEFKGIEGLTEGSDYTYDEASATITLKQGYLAKMYEAKGGYGIIADLTLKFSAGADWHEYVVHSGTPAVNATGTVTGTKSEGLTIPMAFNGAELKSITATENGNRVGPNSGWWQYLQNSGSFSVHYDSADRASGTLTVLPAFFDDGSVTDGDVTFTITFQDGQTLDVNFNIAGETVALK